MKKKSAFVTDYRGAIFRESLKRTKATGSVTFQAIPGLVDEYTKVMSGIWTALGRAPSSTELAYFHECLSNELEAAFDDSPYSKVVVVYDTNPPPQTNLNFRIDVVLSSVESEYADWVRNREPPLFGSEPDAKILYVAGLLLGNYKHPEEIRILDVGAGTGRNTFPLLKLGYKVDALEPSPSLMKILKDNAANEHVPPFRCFECDFLSSRWTPDYHDFIFLSEVVSTHFRSVNQLSRMFDVAEMALKPGGFLLFDIMLPKDDSYNPSDLVIQASEVNWSRVFKRSDLRVATSVTSTLDHRPSTIELVSDESMLDYEKTHQNASDWPPTGWFEHWVEGRDAFDLPANKCPYEMRWLCYRKGP